MDILIDMLTKKVVGVNQTKKIMTYTVKLENANPTKTVTQTVTKQKINVDGKSLYLKSTIEYDKNKIEEVTYSYIIDNKNIIYLPPALENNDVEVTYTIFDNPSVFTLADVVTVKSEEILKRTDFSNILLFEELKEEDLSIELSSNLAHTGMKLISILPNGQIRTNKIQLNNPASKFQVYLEADDGITIEVGNNASNFVAAVNGIVTFDQPTSSIYIRFKNTSAIDTANIRSYGILY